MDETQVEKCLYELTQLFSPWEPNESQRKRWQYCLRPYGFVEGIGGIRKLFDRKGRSRAPNVEDFRSILSNLSSKQKEVQSSSGPNAHIICSGLDDKGLGYIGMIQSLGWSSALVPLRSNPHAVAAMEENQNIYGGLWIYFMGTSVEAMRKSWAIKKEARHD